MNSPWRRPLTWVVIGWNVLMGLWIIGGLASAANSTNDCVGEFAQSCRDGTAIGTTIGLFLILGLAAFGDVILGVIWLVTRKQSTGPDTVYVQSTRPQGWFADPLRRFQMRWWDGVRWTEWVSADGTLRESDPL